MCRRPRIGPARGSDAPLFQSVGAPHDGCQKLPATTNTRRISPFLQDVGLEIQSKTRWRTKAADEMTASFFFVFSSCATERRSDYASRGVDISDTELCASKSIFEIKKKQKKNTPIEWRLEMGVEFVTMLISQSTLSSPLTSQSLILRLSNAVRSQLQSDAADIFCRGDVTWGFFCFVFLTRAFEGRRTAASFNSFPPSSLCIVLNLLSHCATQVILFSDTLAPLETAQ